ncbi:MAG: bifunctional phosphoribosylaminoimidazolecarboxamide formyltransferase/IMP cyclohydrolase [Actinobacteria bacterium]|nr:bifunctional phosphoribosylaminoimidazolecarboxamide formyltransferase/IMP cyclohydrolase [Actinomycetota bacterium]
MRALLSVYDKTGLQELAKGLVELGWDLLASGGTSKALAQWGIAHQSVEELTGAPEMLGGRVKTLHPAIHGGILADRDNPEHMVDLQVQGFSMIDLVVCNLYPFATDPSVELIDVGGPTMVRAAAKNHAHVGIVVSPADYEGLLAELRAEGSLSPATRRRLAGAAFAHTAAYDAAIARWFALERTSSPACSPKLPDVLDQVMERAMDLHYGENPHQSAALYSHSGQPTCWSALVKRSGRELSYLNLFDADAAWRLLHELQALPSALTLAVPAGTKDASGLAPMGGENGGPSSSTRARSVSGAVIVKHANPCGVALASSPLQAYQQALDCDPTSAFGGIVALGATVDLSLAEAISDGPQADVIVAPRFDDAAVERLMSRRKATRLIELPVPEPMDLQMRSLGRALLVQFADRICFDRANWEVVTRARPTDEQWRDIELAWLVCARTTSNAVVLVARGQAVGIGAGQQSRVDAAMIASRKAAGRARGGAAASDAFFPFRDGLDAVANAGVAAVVQPGGSVRDNEVIAAANEHGIAMVFTHERHFRH